MSNSLIVDNAILTRLDALISRELELMLANFTIIRMLRQQPRVLLNELSLFAVKRNFDCYKVAIQILSGVHGAIFVTRDLKRIKHALRNLASLPLLPDDDTSPNNADRKFIHDLPITSGIEGLCPFKVSTKFTFQTRQISPHINYDGEVVTTLQVSRPSLHVGERIIQFEDITHMMEIIRSCISSNIDPKSVIVTRQPVTKRLKIGQLLHKPLRKSCITAKLLITIPHAEGPVEIFSDDSQIVNAVLMGRPYNKKEFAKSRFINFRSHKDHDLYDSLMRYHQLIVTNITRLLPSSSPDRLALLCAHNCRTITCKPRIYSPEEFIFSDLRCLTCGENYCILCGDFKHRGECPKPVDRDTISWIDGNTKRCPNADCGLAIQKNEGCNHMTCGRCRTHFCWLCREILDPRNISEHYQRLDSFRGCIRTQIEDNDISDDDSDDGSDIEHNW